MHETRTRSPETARGVRLVDLDLCHAGLDGTFEGYASLFEKTDLGGDTVQKGAFAASLKARGAAGIRMLFQHDPAMPIGVWSRIHEDARGLYCRGRLAIDAARAREVLALMRAGAVDGLSIGFRAVRTERGRARGRRRLVEIDLWEISVVTFPMLPEARIARVAEAAIDSARRQEARAHMLAHQSGETRCAPVAGRAVATRSITAAGLAARLGGDHRSTQWAARVAGDLRAAARLLRTPSA